MPVSVRKGSGDKPWKIVEIATNKVVGSSKTEKDAKASARLRNAIHAGALKPRKRAIAKRRYQSS